MLLDYLNTVACLILLILLVPIGVIADVRRHPWRVVMLLVIEACYTIQMVAPWVPDFPQSSPPSSVLNIVQAISACLWWHIIWAVARREFGYEPATHPIRRVGDIDTRIKSQ